MTGALLVLLSMEKQTSGLHLEKACLQKAHALSHLIGRINPIFNQKCHFLDYSLIFVYGFLDYWRFLKIQKVDSA
jgi:hypothetical protein